MGSIKREEAIARRKAFLNELFLLQKIPNASEMIRKYGIGTAFLTVLFKNNILSKNPTKYISKREPDEILDSLIEEEFRLRCSQRNHKIYTPNPLESSNFHSIARTIGWTKIGIKYGLNGAVLESFVKDALKFSNEK